MPTVNPTPSSVTHTNPVVKQIKDSAGNVYDIHDEQAVHYLDSWDKVPGSTYIWGANDPATWVNTNKKTTLGDIADELEWAKSQIEAITGGDAVVFKGVSTVALTDLGTETPSPAPSGYVKSTGDLWFYNREEFIYGDDSKWHSLGPQLGSLGALAYKDSASGQYTPAGTVTKPTFSGTPATLTASGKVSGTVSQPSFTGTSTTLTAKGTPSGTVSKPTFSGTPATITVNYDKATDVSQPTFSGATLSATAAYTPAGTVSQPSFSGAVLSSTVSYTPVGTVSKPTFSGTPATISLGDFEFAHINSFQIDGETSGTVEEGNNIFYEYSGYTPKGTISKPNVTVTNSTKAINNMSSVGTLPNWAAQVENEILQFNWGAGTLPTTTSVNVTTGVSASLAASPTFSGNATTIGVLIEYQQSSPKVSYTPAGTISQPTFSGTSTTLTAKGTPSGTVSQPTFSGTAATITAKGTPSGTVSKPTLSTTSTPVKVGYTPAGTVSQPTFSGAVLSSTVSYTPGGTVSQPTLSGATINSTVAYTPAGTVSQPSFNGTPSTVTVS